MKKDNKHNKKVKDCSAKSNCGGCKGSKTKDCN